MPSLPRSAAVATAPLWAAIARPSSVLPDWAVRPARASVQAPSSVSRPPGDAGQHRRRCATPTCASTRPPNGDDVIPTLRSSSAAIGGAWVISVTSPRPPRAGGLVLPASRNTVMPGSIGAASTAPSIQHGAGARRPRALVEAGLHRSAAAPAADRSQRPAAAGERLHQSGGSCPPRWRGARQLDRQHRPRAQQRASIAALWRSVSEILDTHASQPCMNGA